MLNYIMHQERKMRYNVKCFSDHLCTAVENGQHQRGCTKEDEGAPLTIADKERSCFFNITHFYFK